MKCPVCQQEMNIISKDITSNQKSGDLYKEYQKISYTCEKDDIWIAVETPINTQNLA